MKREFLMKFDSYIISLDLYMLVCNLYLFHRSRLFLTLMIIIFWSEHLNFILIIDCFLIINSVIHFVCCVNSYIYIYFIKYNQIMGLSIKMLFLTYYHS